MLATRSSQPHVRKYRQRLSARTRLRTKSTKKNAHRTRSHWSKRCRDSSFRATLARNPSSRSPKIDNARAKRSYGAALTVSLMAHQPSPIHRIVQSSSMGLSAGTRIGPYEIVSPLGAGGIELVDGEDLAA